MPENDYAEVGRNEDAPVYGTVLVPDPKWRRPLTPKRCLRMLAGHQVCANPAVMELNRSRVQHRVCWWGYCAEHTYGRVDLDDGVYFVRGLREGEA